MLFRVLAGVGLFALSYHLRRELARTRPIRERLAAARADRAAAAVRDEDPASGG